MVHVGDEREVLLDAGSPGPDVGEVALDRDQLIAGGLVGARLEPLP
jgi:hypothetical protein